MQDRPAGVLVVDDDLNVAEVVSRYLGRKGFDVDTVSDGLSAADRAAASPPDLVVLELRLPGIDGLEVCRRLRAGATLPVPRPGGQALGSGSPPRALVDAHHDQIAVRNGSGGCRFPVGLPLP